MDSHNLAVVFLPVLVRSADIRQDALMCTMPRKVNSDKRMQQEGQQGESSLGYILKLCIDRYDEVFSLRRDAERREVVQSADVTENSSRSASATSHSSTVGFMLSAVSFRDSTVLFTMHAFSEITGTIL